MQEVTSGMREKRLDNMEQNDREEGRIKLTLKLLGYNQIYYKTNSEVLNELKIISTIQKISICKSSRTNRMDRPPRNKLPRIFLKSTPNGKINRGRPVKRMMDN